MKAPLPAWFDDAIERLGEDEVRLRLGLAAILNEQAEPPPVEAPGLRVAIGRMAVGGLIEVRLWTTAKEAAEMVFDSDGDLLVDEVWTGEGISTGLYLTEADARKAVEAREEAERKRVEVRKRAQASMRARASRHATDDELQRRANKERDAFFGDATLPADWRDRRKP